MKSPDRRSFSLLLYLFIVFSFSWPFQIAYFFLGSEYRPILLVSMIMVGVGTYISGKYIFRDGFKKAGWSWGSPKHYLMAFLFALFLWLLPILLEQFTGITSMRQINIPLLITTFIMSFLVTLLPAFGEEFSWRGYLLPRLLNTFSPRKALLVHGVITWIWHLPVLLVLGLKMGGNPVVTIPIIVSVSLIPTIMHAIVFAYFWSVSRSLAVSTVYHSAFDEVRDTLQEGVGFGPFVEIWQMLSLTILGGYLLWKKHWIEK